MKVSFIQRLGFWFYVCDPQPGDLKAAESKEEEKELKMSVNRGDKTRYNRDGKFQSIISKEAAKLYFDMCEYS